MKRSHTMRWVYSNRGARRGMAHWSERARPVVIAGLVAAGCSVEDSGGEGFGERLRPPDTASSEAVAESIEARAVVQAIRARFRVMVPAAVEPALGLLPQPAAAATMAALPP